MSADTPSEELRARVREEMIAANRRSMYCARLAARKRRIQRTTGALAATFSAAACAVILSGAEVDQWLLVLAVPAAVLSGVCGFGKHGESATRLVNCSVAWADLHHRLQNTWSDIESGHIDREGMREALARVREHARQIDRDVADEPERAQLLDRCHDQAIAWCPARLYEPEGVTARPDLEDVWNLK